MAGTDIAKNSIIFNLIGTVLLASLLLLDPLVVPAAGETSKDEILKKAGELMFSYVTSQGNHVKEEQSDLALLFEADALLTSALYDFKNDFDILYQRIYVRILLKHYEDAIIDIEHIETLAELAWQGANSTKCMLMERLDRPKTDYLSCYKKVVEKLKLVPKGVPYQLNVTYEIAFTSTLANDFVTTGWALNELKKNTEVNQEIFDFYLETINDLKTESGRKDYIYGTFP